MSKSGRRPELVLSFVLFSMTAVLAQDPCDGVSAVDPSGLKTVVVASGLTEPVFVTSPPGDTDRLFIVEQTGVIKIKHRGDPPATTTVLLDLSAKVNSSGTEQGMLSMAFDPDFDTNRFFYVYYTVGGISDSRVSRFEVSAVDPNMVVANSEKLVLQFAEPQTNHNGGLLLFDPDGYLQIFTGDGGGFYDSYPGHAACGNGQSTETLLGKILRIDVAGLDPMGTAPDTTCMSPNFTGSLYTVPSDNPLADGPDGDCDEIYAYGLRNPWRASFDPFTGDLWLADVGQDCQEEVNHVTPAEAHGANYGWRVKEGENCFDPNDPLNCATLGVMCGSSPTCTDPSLHEPLVAYDHAGPDCAASVIGGHVYRGCRMPSLAGTYFYGEYCGWIKSFELDGSGNPINLQDWTSALDPGGALIFDLLSFGVDARQEIYITDQSGTVLKIGPLFTDFEVSGPGAGSLFLPGGAGGDWSWEDLELESMHPVDSYRVYRGVPNGVFTCIQTTTDPEWIGGDPSDPVPGDLFAYVVTAISGGEETSSGDPPRTLSCP